MRFKGFVWPHNPRVYTVAFERRMAVHKIPFGGFRLEGLGTTRRVMKGEGEFVGADAYGQFKALAAVFAENTPGTLVHPLWNTARAWFVGLELEQEPRADYVKYRFEFWEDGSGGQAGLEKLSASDKGGSGGGTGAGDSRPAAADAGARWHTVVKGETMWGLARRYGLSLNSLIALNPQIKNPNLIYIGQKVRVA